jgi:hypothetical protein
VDGKIVNSKGVLVGVVVGDEVFGLKGQKLYDLKGSNIYKLNGDLVGHLSNARGAEKRLDKATDKRFRRPDLQFDAAKREADATNPAARQVVSPRGQLSRGSAHR